MNHVVSHEAAHRDPASGAGQVTEAGFGLEHLFAPRSIAIIGASADETKIGGRPVQLLRRAGYPGAIYPVNPRATDVQGLPAYPSVSALPQVPDLVIIAVAAEAAVTAVQDCAAAGVRAAVVFSSGFAELGAAGEAMQRRLTEAARSSGMRVVGPNCLGVVGVAEKNVATFSVVIEQTMPPAGSLGIVSQSGNLGSFSMLLAAERGLGISRFLTTGNECDVDVADGVAFMARDPATSVILCILETCRDAPRLLGAFEAAHRAGKPVIVLKIGDTEAGQRAALSHTGALAGADAVFDAVFQRVGAVRVRSVEELVELGHAASVLGARLPAGNRVAMLTASGGFGVLLADAASAVGLLLPDPSPAVQEHILRLVPFASARNPVDATAQMSARPELLGEIIGTVIGDDQFDALIIMVASGLNLPRLKEVYLRALTTARERNPDKVVLLCAHGPLDTKVEFLALGYPIVDGAHACCTVLAQLVTLGAARRRSLPAPVQVGPATPLPAEAWQDELGAKRVLAAAGVPVLPEHLAADADAAVAAAERAGFPVVMKIVSPDLPHKTEVGGVVLGLADAAAVRRAYADMLARVRARAPQARITGVLVAPMAGTGTEMILGVARDPVFGPVVMAGLGGIFAEVLRDVAIRPAPVTEADAAEMVRGLKAFAVLDGARGRPRADLPALAGAIAALSRFAVQHAGTVAEVDINPLLVRAEGQGAVALDALLVPMEHPAKAHPA